ncbi:hypothetical protein FDUTEX481_09951 [Tolypothrix sp. PCC 7601]|nr:hypothetical protein FDUTEX481_09951 [Tolypothrix sp. PCC 7601]
MEVSFSKQLAKTEDCSFSLAIFVNTYLNSVEILNSNSVRCAGSNNNGC